MKRITHTAIVFCIVLIASCKGQSQQSLTEDKRPAKEATQIGERVSTIGKTIDCMFQDNNNNYWFATNQDGIYRYDGKNILHITEKDGLFGNTISEIQQDRKGILWFSTEKGFCSFNGKYFTNYTDSIKNAAYGKLRYESGGIFFNHIDGICFYNGKTFINFTIHPANYTPDKNDMYRPYGAYCILADKSGHVWFGTEKGVCHYDGEAFTYITDKDLAGPAVRSIFQDHSGILWFGNNGGGLYRYDGKMLRNITEEKHLGNADFLKKRLAITKPGTLARVFAINEDKSGNLWLGTVDAGVWKFNGTTMTNYTSKDGLSGNSISIIYKDNKGELWYVSSKEAMYHFNGKSFSRVAFD